MKKCIILDIDGSLVYEKYKKTPNKSDRILWDNFHKKNKFYEYKQYKPISEPINLVKDFVSEFDDVEIFIITSRENASHGLIYRNTVDLVYHILGKDLDFKYYLEKIHLYLRDFNDFDKSDVFKEKVYKKYIKDKYEVLFVLEDDLSNIEMFEKNELKVIQVLPAGKMVYKGLEFDKIDFRDLNLI